MVEKQLELLRKERMKPEEPPKPSVSNGQAAPNDSEGKNDKEAGDNSEESRDSQQLAQTQNTVEPVTQSSDDSQSQQEVSLPSSRFRFFILGLCSMVRTMYQSNSLTLYLKLICARVHRRNFLKYKIFHACFCACVHCAECLCVVFFNAALDAHSAFNSGNECSLLQFTCSYLFEAI